MSYSSDYIPDLTERFPEGFRKVSYEDIPEPEEPDNALWLMAIFEEEREIIEAFGEDDISFGYVHNRDGSFLGIRIREVESKQEILSAIRTLFPEAKESDGIFDLMIGYEHLHKIKKV